jgi:serine/threonine-protein kinase
VDLPRKIDKYEIEGLLGEGGFGVVYRAYDPLLKRRVAIKLCPVADPALRRRFLREAEIAGKLQHKNIVIAFAFGVFEHAPFIVWELLPGEDLDHYIGRPEASLPFPVRLDVLVQVAQGLAYAHSRGVIHRDVKPSNVRVLDGRRVKIMDFGVAKLATEQSHLTKTGMTVGTLGYLAPELIMGQPPDSRCDVFSFGVLAYELLTYRRPFRGKDAATVLHNVLETRPAPLTDFWPDCPDPVSLVIERCLARDPQDRLANIEEAVALLREGISELSRASEPTSVSIKRSGGAIAKTSQLAASLLAAGPTRSKVRSREERSLPARQAVRAQLVLAVLATPRRNVDEEPTLHSLPQIPVKNARETAPAATGPAEPAQTVAAARDARRKHGLFLLGAVLAGFLLLTLLLVWAL